MEWTKSQCNSFTERDFGYVLSTIVYLLSWIWSFNRKQYLPWKLGQGIHNNLKLSLTFYDRCIKFLGTLRLRQPQWTYHRSELSLQPDFLHHESWICRNVLEVLNKGKSKKTTGYQPLWYISLATIWRGREEVNSAIGGYQKFLNGTSQSSKNSSH